MTADRNVTATFSIINRVRLTAGVVLNHASMQSAYNAAVSGAEIKSQTFQYPETLLFDQGKDVVLSGGWDAAYAAPSVTGSRSTVQGTLVIRSGSVKVRNISIR
jgi:hypothetical protein